MRRITIVALSAALLTATALVVQGAAAGSAGTAGTTARAAANTGPPTGERAASLARQLASARLATAKYATSLHAAKADGYQIITRMIPDMGRHLLNRPSRASTSPSHRSWSTNATGAAGSSPPWNGSSPRRRHPRPCQARPTGPSPPPATTETAPSCSPGSRSCAPSAAPRQGARFNFWHPDLVTLHVWLWYPNPAGLYSGTNPLIRPFNRG